MPNRVGQCVQDSAENMIRGNSFLSIFDLKLPNEAGKKFSCVLYFARSHVFFRSIGNRFLNGWSFIKTYRLSVRVLVCLSKAGSRHSEGRGSNSIKRRFGGSVPMPRRVELPGKMGKNQAVGGFRNPWNTPLDPALHFQQKLPSSGFIQI